MPSSWHGKGDGAAVEFDAHSEGASRAATDADESRLAHDGGNASAQEKIAASIGAQDVPARLAWRIAFQLRMKCDVAELREQAVWPL
jgi:hypothetical protein